MCSGTWREELTAINYELMRRETRACKLVAHGSRLKAGRGSQRQGSKAYRKDGGGDLGLRGHVKAELRGPEIRGLHAVAALCHPRTVETHLLTVDIARRRPQRPQPSALVGRGRQAAGSSCLPTQSASCMPAGMQDRASGRRCCGSHCRRSSRARARYQRQGLHLMKTKGLGARTCGVPASLLAVHRFSPSRQMAQAPRTQTPCQSMAGETKL